MQGVHLPNGATMGPPPRCISGGLIRRHTGCPAWWAPACSCPKAHDLQWGRAQWGGGIASAAVLQLERYQQGAQRCTTAVALCCTTDLTLCKQNSPMWLAAHTVHEVAATCTKPATHVLFNLLYLLANGVQLSCHWPKYLQQALYHSTGTVLTVPPCILQVGPELPEPSVVSWDPTLRYLALAYQRQVQLMRVQPQMEVLGSLPVSGTSAVCWGVRQLYLTTPTSVLLAFVAAEEKAAGGFTLLDMEPSGGARKGSASTLQFIQLAGLTGTAATSSLRAGSSGATASLPGPGPRPAGPLALLGPRRGNLWLANSLGQPVLLPLTHPGIRARCLCAQGDLVGAVAVGRRSMAPSCHDSLASFLHLQGGVPGAHLALMGLQGLSLEMESELCMATGQWRRACVCCEALLRSFSDRTTLGTAEAFAQGDPAGARSANDSNLLTAAGVTGVTAQLATAAQLAAAAQASTPEAPAAKQQQQLWGIMGFGGLFVDNYQLPQDKEEEEPDKQKDPLANGRIAWGAPLRHNWRFENAPKRASNTGQGEADSTSTSLGAAAADGLVAAAATTAAAAQPPPASALSLTMRLVEGSQAAGITDVTRRASQLLLAHRDLLSPSQLARLAAKMAEVGMYTDINGLVDSSVASGSHHGQALGFVAAALTGNALSPACPV
eukprot:GHRR01029020.1.p1 GENE.GHRR01029020.1~~GHRR01029020.1.p1  ORF type:complete len:665 (+),score=238.43 GHRR01029020.1:41-2035(+)